MKRWMLILVTACSTAKPPEPATPANVKAAVDLAARRAQMIGWLHEYEEAAVFPVDAYGRPQSVFKDAAGTRCAMAELIHRTGHDELVDEVAKVDNTLRLADVHEGPLYQWMLTSGLTQDEIAMVQGALDINYELMPVEQPATTLAIAKAQIKGRLETAETALRNATSIAILDLLPKQTDRVATGPVVPKSAIRVTPARVDPQMSSAWRTTVAWPRTSGTLR